MTLKQKETIEKIESKGIKYDGSDPCKFIAENIKLVKEKTLNLIIKSTDWDNIKNLK